MAAGFGGFGGDAVDCVSTRCHFLVSRHRIHKLACACICTRESLWAGASLSEQGHPMDFRALRGFPSVSFWFGRGGGLCSGVLAGFLGFALHPLGLRALIILTRVPS